MKPRPVVLVTGAAQRIGRTIALDLAAHGWDLAIHARRSRAEAEATAAECRALGARAAVLLADLDVEAQTEALLPAAVEALGRVDALVNNASRFEYDAPGGIGYAAIASHLMANAGAPVLLAQALHRHLVARGSDGCVVNLLDQKLYNPNPDYFSYTLSKAALQAATTMLAQACAPRMRVCAVAPGVTLVSGPMNEAEFATSHTMTPLGRSSTPEDVARSVRFLLDSPAITGATLLVDGGQHLQAQSRDVLFLARDAGAPATD